jgi:predicted GH43/DUF377 family glycosyl hydrolase
MRRMPTLFAWALCFAATAAAEPPPELDRWFGTQDWRRDVEGPIVSLGKEGEFDDQHIFAPAVIEEEGKFSLWYCGSRGTPGNRVFRLGLATSDDGRVFRKAENNPVYEFGDGKHSVLTPALLRDGNGTAIREAGKLRMWFAAATLGKGGLHTLHEATSSDGIHWSPPSGVLLENAYCPSVLKTDAGYEMWFSDVSRRPWVLRHATSTDGTQWKVNSQPVVQLSQPWEAEVLVYPTVLKIDGAYLLWYGSYFGALRRETTAIGFAASTDGKAWHKHPQNPVLRPHPQHDWESNYVGSGCIARLADGSFRYWYASRKAPPFNNLYFAINTARWAGPAPLAARLRLPPLKDDRGVLGSTDARLPRVLDTLEVIDAENVVVRAWYRPEGTANADDATFVDLWVRGIDTAGLVAGLPAHLTQVFQVTGTKLFDTTCGRRSVPLLEPAK